MGGINWLQHVSQVRQASTILLELVVSKIDVDTAIQELQSMGADAMMDACRMVPDLIMASSDTMAVSALEQLHQIICRDMQNPQNNPQNNLQNAPEEGLDSNPVSTNDAIE